MIKKWIEPILDHSVNRQERMFRLLTGIAMAALFLMLICGIIFRDGMENHFLLAGAILYMAIVFKLSLKLHHVNIGAICTAFMFFVLFPLNFFMSGGMYGGAPIWFVFCFAYISFAIVGKIKFVFLAVCPAITVACYYIAYNNPDSVSQYTETTAYFNSITTVIINGLLICSMVIFQNIIYIQENRISEQQKKEIEKLNQSEKRFFASMSHEIRTPINTIIGLNEMILRSDVSNDVVENARHIQGASKMLLTLINDILDVSKMESGKMDIVNVSYETGVFFSDIINIIWVKAKEKGLEFHLNIDSSIPSMLCGDEVRIKQILINILNNSIKYTPKGSVTLSVKCELITINRVRVYYNVTDTGMGIKKESIPHLFDAFQRVDEEKNRYIEGTGLGLSIVKQLVDLMGGEITVNSVYTQGSTFLVTLEQDIIDGKALGEFSLESHVNSEERPRYKQSFEAPEARLLIVDDNEMNLKVAAKLLTDTKIQIDTATSAAECLKLTQEKQYHGILMDHLMPEMDGIECLHAIREQKGGLCHDVPVIALTANAGSESQQLYRKEGFTGYLAKPVNGMLLEAAVMNILPKDLVVVTDDNAQTEIGKDVLMFDIKQRIPIAVTTDSMSDIPKELLAKFGISIQPYYIYTEEGRFLDGKEIEAEDLLAYIYSGKKGYSNYPEVEDYEKFFAKKLTEAQNIIHITMASKVSEAYRTASEAAKSFDNVSVFDSGQISSGIGLIALTAAFMARNNAPKEAILERLIEMRKRVTSDFIVKDTDMLCYGAKFPQYLSSLCKALMLHPIIGMRREKMTAGGIEIGDYDHVTRMYIRKVLKNPDAIDRRLLIIVYVGMDEDELNNLKELVNQCCTFENIYLQKASCGITINAGPGAFGLMFFKSIKKNEVF